MPQLKLKHCVIADVQMDEEMGERHVNKKNGKVNTDHRYKGVRFYFETDSIWTTKINND